MDLKQKLRKITFGDTYTEKAPIETKTQLDVKVTFEADADELTFDEGTTASVAEQFRQGITNADQFTLAADAVKVVKKARKRIADWYAPFCGAAHKAWKALTTARAAKDEPLALREALLREKMEEFMNAQLAARDQAFRDNPQSVPQVSVPNVKGVSMRESREWDVIDVGLIPNAYMTPDVAKINAEVALLGILAERKIPGIKVRSTAAVTIRS